MPASPPRPLGSALLLALVVAAAPAQAQHSPAAERVLDRARGASGGAGWNALRGLHEIGTDAGFRYEAWRDAVRYGERIEVRTPAGPDVRGYNGAGDWRRWPDGRLTGAPDAAHLAEVRTDAFLGAYGYYFPGRFDLRSSLIGTRQHEGRTFDVLRVQPAGGEPRELWFDRRTGLLGVVVDESGPRRSRVELSDYRRVGRLQLPFKAVTYGGGRPRPEERQAERIELSVPDRALFSLPRPKP